MSIAILKEKVKEAISNIKENNKKVLNIEELEMGLKAAESMNMKNHVSGFEVEIRKKKFEQYDFPRITIEEMCKEFYPNKRLVVSKQSNLSIDSYNSRYTSHYHLVSPIFRRHKLTLGNVRFLKSLIPAPIMTIMSEIEKLHLVSAFYALGYPKAFEIPQVDPIIVAVISNKDHWVDPLAYDSAMYFVGKYE